MANQSTKWMQQSESFHRAVVAYQWVTHAARNKNCIDLEYEMTFQYPGNVNKRLVNVQRLAALIWRLMYN